MARQIKQENNYQSRLLKLIPSEIIAAYLVIVGFIPAGYEHGKLLLTVITIVLLILIPFYLIRFQSVKAVFQIIFTSISFLVWVYSMGGPFVFYGIHEPVFGSSLLVIWTLLIPFVIKPKNE